MLSYGAFLVVGLWFLAADYVEKFLQIYILSDWFQEGIGAAWATTWAVCLVGLPVLFAVALFAWHVWSEYEQQTLEGKQE